MEIGISRNDDEATVDFAVHDVHPLAAAKRAEAALGVRRDVPIAEIGTEVARLRAAGHRVTATGSAMRRLAAAGADLTGVERPQ